MSALVHLEDVSLRQGGKADSSWSLKCNAILERGCAYSLHGNNMSGKSTFLRYLAGIHHVEAEYGGPRLTSGARRRSFTAALLDHSDYMFPDLSVLDTLRVSSPGLWLGQERRVRNDLIDLLNTAPQMATVRSTTPTGALSSGGQALLKAARVKTISPDLVLIDEVTSNFDDELVRVFFERIAGSITPEQSLVMVSHSRRDHEQYRDSLERAGLCYRKLRCTRKGGHSWLHAV